MNTISTIYELKETTFSGSIREKNSSIMYEDIIYSEHLKTNKIFTSSAQHPPRSSQLWVCDALSGLMPKTFYKKLFIMPPLCNLVHGFNFEMPETPKSFPS